jgi:uncharacterized protein YndB with AHSA1/START domain
MFIYSSSQKHVKTKPMKTFSYSIFINATAGRLWEALTVAAVTRQYWNDLSIESSWKAGSEVCMRKPDGSLNWQGKILTLVPDTQLSYTFDPSVDDHYKGETISKVTWTIERFEQVCKLSICHEALSEKFEKDVRVGWPYFLSSLKSLLETGKSLPRPHAIDNSYTLTMSVHQPIEKVFKNISDVSAWWTKDFAGDSTKLHDEFTVIHPGAHYSKQRLITVVSNQKWVWLVTESKLDWLNNKEEWTGTRMIFELTTADGKTIVTFTHEGLVPGLECYERVAQGWDIVIKEQLLHYIQTGKRI